MSTGRPLSSRGSQPGCPPQPQKAALPRGQCQEKRLSPPVLRGAAARAARERRHCPCLERFTT